MSEPEVMLWSRLRKRAGNGVAFRRQHPIGFHVLDFYCSAARLAVEVDGPVTRKKRRSRMTSGGMRGSEAGD
jgi:very-short-patch-repair endonuclease